ncbi:hypothetical protein PG990_011483 [Apiospora arundinis]
MITFVIFSFATLAAAATSSAPPPTDCQPVCEAFIKLASSCSGSNSNPLSEQLQCICGPDYSSSLSSSASSLSSCVACLRSSGEGDAFADEMTRLQTHCNSAASSKEQHVLHEL